MLSKSLKYSFFLKKSAIIPFYHIGEQKSEKYCKNPIPLTDFQYKIEGKEGHKRAEEKREPFKSNLASFGILSEKAHGGEDEFVTVVASDGQKIGQRGHKIKGGKNLGVFSVKEKRNKYS